MSILFRFYREKHATFVISLLSFHTCGEVSPQPEVRADIRFARHAGKCIFLMSDAVKFPKNNFFLQQERNEPLMRSWIKDTQEKVI